MNVSATNIGMNVVFIRKNHARVIGVNAGKIAAGLQQNQIFTTKYVILDRSCSMIRLALFVKYCIFATKPHDPCVLLIIIFPNFHPVF